MSGARVPRDAGTARCGCPTFRIMIVLLSVGPGNLECTMTEDLSPAERYAAARRRAAEQATALAGFREMYDFGLDPFQIEACRALEAGKGVLVAAPTGSGKTIIGEFAVHLALQQGRKCFYTTPIKALSNQKYSDLCRRYGSGKVGLLTGDNSINADAPVVVMTTEVLRNMLYAGSQTLRGLGYVVMDEVHYLSDRFRGAVWEEVIIHLPASVTLVSLSATVSNYEEFADWLVTVRGETEVVVSEHRPVPLWQHMLVGRRMFDLFHDADAARKHDVHPELLRYTREMERRLELTDRSYGPGNRGRSRRWQPPPRPEVVDRLERAGLLPAILFIFSRAGCDAAVQQCLSAGLRLTDADERAEIRRIAEAKVAGIPREDLSVLATGSGSTVSSGASPPTTPACCPPSRRRSRSASCRGWSRRSSRPRPWRWASTCRPAASCSSGWSSSTARPTPT